MTTATMINVWRPEVRRSALIYDTAIIVCGSILVAVLAQIRINLPLSPVPVTGQTLGVLLVGCFLGGKRAALALIAYLVEGVSGLPVFAGGASGLAYLFGPTGGYLFGFVAGAYVCGFLAEKGWVHYIVTTLATLSLGIIVIFYFGICWLFFFTGSESVLKFGLYPFVFGEVIKIAVAAIVLPVSWRLLGYK